MTALEDRDVPTPVVSITAVSEGYEGGQSSPDAYFLITTSEAIEGDGLVYLSRSGTATDDDYQLVNGDGNAVYVGRGRTSVEVYISLNEGAEQEGPKTVTITLVPSEEPEYVLGNSSATITIFDDEEPPTVTANDDEAEAHGVAPVELAVLANDTGSSSLTVTSWTQPADGTLAFDDATQSFTYTPTSRLASANDTFTYTVTDGTSTDTATATINRVFWVSPTGGDWSDPENWNAELLPTAEDDVTIALPSTETVLVPAGFAAEVHSLNSTARFEVAGGLSLFGASALSGDFDVEGSVNVAVPDVVPTVAPGEELSLLPYLGTPGGLLLTGGTISGTLTTQPTSQTTIGAGTVRIAGAGSLGGDGWVSVTGGTSKLSFDGNAATVARLYAGGDSMIDGTADLTVADALIAQQAKFLGAAGSTLTVNTSADLGAALGATVFDVRNFLSLPGSVLKIAGDLRLKGKASMNLIDSTRWTKGTISITGESRLVNADKGEFYISQGCTVTGGVRADGTPDGTFENNGTIVLDGDNVNPPAGMAALVRFENIAFANQAGAKVGTNPLEALAHPPVPPYGLIFSGGTGVHKGLIDLDEKDEMGQRAQVILTDGAVHAAYSGSEFKTHLVVQDDAALLVPLGDSAKIKELELTGGVLPGVVRGGGTIEVYGEFDWTWGTVRDVTVSLTSQIVKGERKPAKMTVGPNANPNAFRTLDGGAVKILGEAEVTADWKVVDGGRVLVDTDTRPLAPAGKLQVIDASITTDAQSPGLPRASGHYEHVGSGFTRPQSLR